MGPDCGVALSSSPSLSSKRRRGNVPGGAIGMPFRLDAWEYSAHERKQVNGRWTSVFWVSAARISSVYPEKMVYRLKVGKTRAPSLFDRCSSGTLNTGHGGNGVEALLELFIGGDMVGHQSLVERVVRGHVEITGTGEPE